MNQGWIARDYPVDALPIQRRRLFYTLFGYHLGPPNINLWQDIPPMSLRSLEGYLLLISATWKALWVPCFSWTCSCRAGHGGSLATRVVLTVTVTPAPGPHDLPAGPLIESLIYILAIGFPYYAGQQARPR